MSYIYTNILLHFHFKYVYQHLPFFLVLIIPKTGQFVLDSLKIGAGHVAPENIILPTPTVMGKPPFLNYILTGWRKSKCSVQLVNFKHLSGHTELAYDQRVVLIH